MGSIKADAELCIDFRPSLLTTVELRVIIPVHHTTEAASSQQRHFVRKLIATNLWNKTFSCFFVLLLVITQTFSALQHSAVNLHQRRPSVRSGTQRLL
jgi:hypothetical protein